MVPYAEIYDRTKKQLKTTKSISDTQEKTK